MKDDFSKYEKLRDDGADAAVVYRQGIGDGLDTITIIRMLRAVFELDLTQAKEVIAVAEGAKDLSDAQSGLLPAIMAAMDEDE